MRANTQNSRGRMASSSTTRAYAFSRVVFCPRLSVTCITKFTLGRIALINSSQHRIFCHLCVKTPRALSIVDAHVTSPRTRQRTRDSACLSRYRHNCGLALAWTLWLASLTLNEVTIPSFLSSTISKKWPTSFLAGKRRTRSTSQLFFFARSIVSTASHL